MSRNKAQFDRLKKTFIEDPKYFRDQVESILEANAQEMATKARLLAPKHDGNLSRSIGVLAPSEENSPFVITRSVFADKAIAPYAPFVEFGTKTRTEIPPELKTFAAEFKGSGNRGRVGGGAYKNITQWAMKKGLSAGHAMRIFLSIMRFGIHPHPFMYPAFKIQKEKVKQDLLKMSKRNG